MSTGRLIRTPTTATAAEGIVLVDGPGVALSMTPKAARLSARSLRSAARAAMGKRPDG